MDIKALHRQMAQYNRWKRQLAERLQAFELWCHTHRLMTDDAKQYLARARQLLDAEHFTIACVGEFSRGKTELINALLYSHSLPRLLPSQPGRTTMCPTEIFFEPEQPAGCVRLLPIETRRSGASLYSFKRIPNNWFKIRFDPADPESVERAIGQVSAHKNVTHAEARKLGFDTDTLDAVDGSDRVQVPTWRHALINLDHPLLREGLRIVDTPGLNALGNEPELTLKTLPEAQAIVFLLAADSGVSASDMAIWRDHIRDLQDNHCTAVLALLNKIDTLWDELAPEAEVNASIERVRHQTARQLSLAPEHVLPLSARQALIAKTQQRSSTLLRSNFPQLEQRLGECVLRSQQQIVSHRLVTNSHDMVVHTYKSLTHRIEESEQELETLAASDHQTLTKQIRQQRETIRRAHHRFHKQSLSLRTSQRMLDNQRAALTAPINEQSLKRLIDETYERLSGSWTTLGLSQAVAQFFEDVDASVNQLLREIDRANKLMHSIYERPEHGSDLAARAGSHELNITAQRRQLRNLQASADRFRHSLNSVLTSKHTLIKRFIATLVREVQHNFHDLNEAVDHWLDEALTPLVQHNQHQKQLLQHQMVRLGELRDESSSRTEKLDTLRESLATLCSARDDLAPLYREVTTDNTPAPADSADIVSLQSARRAQTGA